MSTASSTRSRPLPLRLRRPAFIIPTVLLGAALATYAVTHLTASEQAQAAPSAPPPPKVTVAPVERQLVTDYEELTGRVDSIETVDLRARVSGHIQDVRFQAGEIVHRGDVLFTIDPRWYRAEFDLALARADQARAQAEVADSEARRANELLAVAAVSTEEAEARRTRAHVARAAVASAEAALATARLNLEHTEVRAPIDGRISRALVTAGNLISGAPGGATLLATIVSTGEAYVYADIDESTLLKFNRLLRENRLALENGRVPVEMQLADESGYPRRGYIESTDNRLNPATGSLALRLVFANRDQALVPGLFARVRVPVGAPRPSLLVSERAIGTDQSQKFVLAVAADNKAVYRSVKLGGSFHDKRVIQSGLEPGDRVIVNGLQRVRPGMTVQPELLAAEATTQNANANRLASR
ncbi:efflux RND transporter periplasmic adaptor subunit [Opitutus terrae]|uniref:Efflux transporter, RND family, MFP subunit n=1 Tax=Opitutus terrae (strain DSM 11246 / JCM 15787 / PB90-1) TaxID=452637 RepID=B1ZYJ3_OPITP|nr:efflux RND transporter periplasmic adaptor subunit [Opitutus terrae]ACB77089.1 efflux transporter, RND family, MFP subunit [Opitutus terrae PB90-1]